MLKTFINVSPIYRQFSTSATSIVIQYKDLKNGKNVENLIELAYGPKGLGILFVNGIPDFPQMRQATLPLISKIPQLPSQILKQYIRPEIFHSLGWSCGVQQFQGKYDKSKGSFYFNASRDKHKPLTQQQSKFYTEDEKKILFSQNKWIKEVPQIQKNVKALAARMIQVGALLAKQIDSYGLKNTKNYEKNHLHRVITTGNNHVGRLLHYFPFQNKQNLSQETEDDWCGWHNDHGSLTALCPAMLIDAEGKQYKTQTASGGLYAKNRFAQMARIKIPPTMLGFQLGQCVQIKSGGQLEATPHCVVKNPQLAGKKIARNTFALFMEPNYLQKLDAPKDIPDQNVTQKQAYKIPALKDRWINGMYFKDFHKKTIEYYS